MGLLVIALLHNVELQKIIITINQYIAFAGITPSKKGKKTSANGLILAVTAAPQLDLTIKDLDHGNYLHSPVTCKKHYFVLH